MPQGPNLRTNDAAGEASQSSQENITPTKHMNKKSVINTTTGTRTETPGWHLAPTLIIERRTACEVSYTQRHVLPRAEGTERGPPCRPCYSTIVPPPLPPTLTLPPPPPPPSAT